LVSDFNNSTTDLEYYTCHQKLHGAMEPNTKMFIEELMKEVRNEIHSLRLEIKDNFIGQEVSLNVRISELATVAQHRDERVAVLESATVDSDKAFTTWKPKVDSSLTSIKLELTKFSTFFVREGRLWTHRHHGSSRVG
jgi:hypothetical protein